MRVRCQFPDDWPDDWPDVLLLSEEVDLFSGLLSPGLEEPLPLLEEDGPLTAEERL